jgi:hypothetical protein
MKSAGVIESAPAVGVLRARPVGTHHCHQQPAGADRRVDVLDEVDAQLHAEVHEDLLLAEAPA